MKIFAFLLITALLLGCAQAEFYTSNEDLHYHGDIHCVEGSIYEISADAAVQFEKIACPVCVNRKSVKGEIIEIKLPEGYVSLQSVDIKGRKLLLCGYADQQKHNPWIAMYDIAEGTMQSALGEDYEIIRDAKFLSDGKIAVIRSGHDQKFGEDSWKIQLIENGKVVSESAGMNYLSKIWPVEGGFIVHGASKLYQYRLARCDNEGNVLWTRNIADIFPTSDNQPGLSGILVGEDIHIAYGSRYEGKGDTYIYEDERPVVAAFDDEGRLIGQTQIEKIIGTHTRTLYDKDMNPIGWEDADSCITAFNGAAWAEDGVIFTCAGRPDYAMKLGPEGESWFSSFAHLNDAENGDVLVDGEKVEGLGVRDILPCGEDYLLLMNAEGGKGNYVRLARMNSRGVIVEDWFEDIGEIVAPEKPRLLQSGDEIYILVYGLLMDEMEAYEKGLTQPQIARKMILKKVI